MEELDLKDLFELFLEKKKVILLIIVAFLILGGVYSFIFVKPKYQSYTTLLLTQIKQKEETEDDTKISQTDLTINSNLVSTYSELIKSKAVLREVISSLYIDNLEEKDIKNNTKVSSVADTELIEIKVTNKEPNDAASIANKIAEVFSEKVKEIYNISNVYIVDKAEADEVPSNINHTKDLVIFAFIGVVVSAAYVLLVNMLDNTIKTEADVEKVTGLLVLASIPIYDTDAKKGGK